MALDWGARINGKSPTAQRMLKFSFNLIDDGLVGQQVFAGEATRLAYMTDEAAEGTDAFLEKRDPGLVAVPLVLLSRIPAAPERRGGRGVDVDPDDAVPDHEAVGQLEQAQGRVGLAAALGR